MPTPSEKYGVLEKLPKTPYPFVLKIQRLFKTPLEGCVLGDFCPKRHATSGQDILQNPSTYVCFQARVCTCLKYKPLSVAVFFNSHLRPKGL
jgi:hypothetical protein